MSLAERFWINVDRRGDGECWPWLGHTDARGYGRVKSAVHSHRAHRAAWALANGCEIPPGMCVCHSCDNPPCVNPAHLWLGTRGDNNRDRSAKGRSHKFWASQTYCKRGHEFTPENTYIRPDDGSRNCVTCRAFHRQKSRAAKREQEQLA